MLRWFRWPCAAHGGRAIAREWLVALAAYALLVAPFGCQFSTGMLGSGGDTPGPSSTGLFVNPETSDPLMVAGRNPAGDELFVYGTRAADGGLGEVETVLVRTAAGEESFIEFASGRPTYIRGADGSSVRITYTDVSADRLAAEVEVFAAEAGVTESYAVDIDLQLTANQVAAAIEQLTGLRVDVPHTSDPAVAKGQQRALGPLALIAIGAGLVLLAQFTLAVGGQLFTQLARAVSTAVQVALLIILSPVLLFASILGDVSVRIDETPLLDVFIELPDRP